MATNALSAEEIENLAAADPKTLIACWGDSLTVGGQDGGATYPEQAAALFSTPRAIATRGYGGETSTQIKTRFLADTPMHQRECWIWVGRNNFEQLTEIQADIAAMVAALPHDRFLIGGVINGEYVAEYEDGVGWLAIEALKSALASTYGPRFVDLRTPLVATGAPGGIAENATDYARDIVPRAPGRFDAIHLTAALYGIVAETFYAAHVAMGW